MKRKISGIFIFFAGAILVAAAPVRAARITFNLGVCNSLQSPAPTSSNCPNQNLGTTIATFADSTGDYTITASGAISGSFDDLYIKNDAANGDAGLGLNGTTENEINNSQSIIIDMGDLADSGFTSATIYFESLQQHPSPAFDETAEVFNWSPTINYPWVTGDSNGDASLNVSFSRTNHFIYFTVPTDVCNAAGCEGYGNYLISSVVAPSVAPEPASLLLLGTGLLALAWMMKRRNADLRD